MDKYEYRLRSDEILRLIEDERYIEAAKIADIIDWRRVKNVSMLIRVAALYKINRRNEDSRAILMLAYNRYPNNRSVLQALCEVSIELDDIVAATEFYKEFKRIAPRDNGVFTLRYRILESQEASLEERIELLEELKKRDYQEEWAYELAYLYHRVGLATKCVEECDDIILWFGDGPYVMKAMELKMLHAPLTPIQEKKYALMQGDIQGIPQDEEYSLDYQQYGDNYLNEESVEEQQAEDNVEPDAYYAEEPENDGYDNNSNEQIKNNDSEENMTNMSYTEQEISRAYADMSQYNTINLQKVVAEGMRELYQDDEDMYEENRQDIARIEEIERASGRIAAINEGISEREPEPNTGAIRTVIVPEQSTSRSIAQNEYADAGMQYNDPYVSDTEQSCEEKSYEFRPMTGQMNIQDVIIEWERMKKENEEKRKEGIRQLVIQQTGQLFKDFDESINSGILGELKEEEKAINEILPTRTETFLEDDTEEDVLMTGKIDFDDAVPVPVAVHSYDDLNKEEDEELTEKMDAEESSDEIYEEATTEEYVEESVEEGSTDEECEDVSVKECVEELSEEECTEEPWEEEYVEESSDEIYEEATTEEEYVEESVEEGSTDEEYEDVSVKEYVEESSEEECTEEPWEEEYVEESSDEIYEEATTEEGYVEESVEEGSTDEEYEDVSVEEYEEGSSEEDEVDEIEEIEEIEELQNTYDNQEEEYNEENSGERIEEVAEDYIMKTQELTMNTAEIGSLPDKIIAATKKETTGSKKEELREFGEAEEQLFDDFATNRKVKKQIIYAIDNMKLKSYSGNVIITGEPGIGTLKMAKNLIRRFQVSNEEFSGKIAKITGEQLNIRELKETFEKVRNGALIIEEAHGLLEKTAYDMISLLNQEEFSIIVFLIDSRKGIGKLLSKQAMLTDYFNIRVDLAEMDNNALVDYAKNYALQLEYSIDELGLLALHTRIANVQTGNHVVTKDEVRDIIDEAIWKSKRSRLKNFVDLLLSKRYDEEDMIVLRERDFM